MNSLPNFKLEVITSGRNGQMCVTYGPPYSHDNPSLSPVQTHPLRPVSFPQNLAPAATHILYLVVSSFFWKTNAFLDEDAVCYVAAGAQELDAAVHACENRTQSRWLESSKPTWAAQWVSITRE